MFLYSILSDILEFIIIFLNERDKLNLFKTDKMLIYNFKLNEIRIQLNLKYLSITDNVLFNWNSQK